MQGKSLFPLTKLLLYRALPPHKVCNLVPKLPVYQVEDKNYTFQVIFHKYFKVNIVFNIILLLSVCSREILITVFFLIAIIRLSCGPRITIHHTTKVCLNHQL